MWVCSIGIMIMYRNGLFVVLEYFIVIGISWIGVEGLSNVGLFYQPLTYLKYIFLYNYKVKG